MFSVGRYAVVVEKIPFPLVFRDGMVRCPSHNWGEDDSLIDKRSVRIVADGIA